MGRKLVIIAFVLAVLGGNNTLLAQGDQYGYSFPTSNSCTPAFNRATFHDDVDKIQKKILNSDGRVDDMFSPSANDAVNSALTHAIVNKIDDMQCEIEKDSAIVHMEKIRILRGIADLLNGYYTNISRNVYKATLFPDIYKAFIDTYKASQKEEDISVVLNRYPYYVVQTIVNTGNLMFGKAKGFDRSKQLLVVKSCEIWPEKCFLTLKNNPDVPYVDSLVKEMGKRYPAQLYDYAQASNKLGAIIRNITDDKLVATVVQMAGSKSGQQYFPFLHNLVNGSLTLQEIDKVKEDDLGYFRLLVNTHLDYVKRQKLGEEIFEYKGLNDRLEKKAVDIYVNTINALHNENDVVRFKILQPLTAEELYYVAVAGDGVIYTSSFVNGVYPLMMKKAGNKGNELLNNVQHDRYRRFIKMAAGYNTLGDFLKSYPDIVKQDSLMTAFVSNLERSEGMEDGVDVADSYGSLVESLKPLSKAMLNNIEINYQRNVTAKNQKGIVIYNILRKLFYSADSTIDLTKELGIPPVYQVPYQSLADETGTVIIQVFFYGDKDGQGIFSPFVNMFANNNWKIDNSNPQWVTITSIKGKPVSIYANRPLPEETGEDEEAQVALGNYLRENNLLPTVTIHRGHSYFANSTIEHMFPSSKIVFLGSCGGYHLNYDVLKKCPDAHIISSKQIGKFKINVPFFRLLTEKVRNGSDIEWIPFWKEFEKMAQVEGFEDYIPPYKNLGAIFIKAYKIAMEETNDNSTVLN